MSRFRRSTNEELIFHPHAANTCSTASRVPNTTRCLTSTKRRVVYTTAADNSLNPKTRYNVPLTPSSAGACLCTKAADRCPRGRQVSGGDSHGRSGPQGGREKWAITTSRKGMYERP